jgi:rhodanese-related sulfurtransferase
MHDIIAFMQQHWLLSLALIVILFLLIMLEFVKIKRSGNQVNPQQAVNMINHQNACVVDVRSTESFANGHIVGSVSLPFKEFEEKYKKIEKFKSQPVIVVCARGVSAQTCVTSLQKKGFNAFLLSGGITAWQQAEMPLVKD